MATQLIAEGRPLLAALLGFWWEISTVYLSFSLLLFSFSCVENCQWYCFFVFSVCLFSKQLTILSVKLQLCYGLSLSWYCHGFPPLPDRVFVSIVVNEMVKALWYIFQEIQNKINLICKLKNINSYKTKQKLFKNRNKN